MIRTIVTSILAPAFLLLGGCQGKTLVQDIAKQVRKAYEQAEFVRFQADLRFGSVKQSCAFVNEQGERIRLDVYNEAGTKIYELRTRPVGDALVYIQERNYLGDEAEDYLVSRRYFLGDAFETICAKDIPGCLYAGFLQPWVGEQNQKIAWAEEIMSTYGKHQGFAEIDGRPCHIIRVVRWLPRAEGKPFKVVETLAIDKDSFMIRSWSQDFLDSHRTRKYTYLDGIPAPEEFRLPPVRKPDFPVSLPAEASK